jgi:hypothetical protein
MGLFSGPGGDIYDNEISGGFLYGIHAEASRIARNVVTQNRIGISIANDPSLFHYPTTVDRPAVVADNVIADNEVGINIGHGVGVLAITGNDVLHNKLNGTQRYTEEHRPQVNPVVVVQDNNIIGNGYGNPEGNCGLVNNSYGFIWAANNYWGALGTSDRVCNGSGSSTQIDPVRLVPDSRVSD